MDKFIDLKDVNAGYDDTLVLDKLSLSIKKGDKISVIGPSGCGKTTLLYIMAGILNPFSGTVYVDHKPLGLKRKGTSLILQSYGLFPWKTVWDNIMLPFKLNGTLDQIAREKGNILIESIGLKGLEGKYPSQLSGGQKQRVAIGRAWIKTPDLLLMDEPFSALDAMTRERLQETLLSLDKQNETTSVLVTHSIEEAIYMSSKIVVMTSNGGIHKIVENPEQGDLDYRNQEAFYSNCHKLRGILQEASDEKE